MEETQERYVGLDVHKQFIMIALVTKDQKVVMKPKRVDIHKFQAWAKEHLYKTDQVALESSTNAWWVYDHLIDIVGTVNVANTHQVKMISAGHVKTDHRDATVLARLLAAGLLPTIWVPPLEVRELRSLIAHRKRLVRDRSAVKNRLHSMLHRHSVPLPDGDPFSLSNQDWWDQLELSDIEKLQVSHELKQMAQLTSMIKEADEQIATISVQSPWRDQVAFILQFTGIGLNSAMTILGAIGEIERFPTAKQLVGYSGLGARVYSSGQTHRTGKISKTGRRELRSIMIECAWSAVSFSQYWKNRYENLAYRIGKMKAIVAIARIMLVIIWKVLTKRMANYYENPDKIIRSLMKWAETNRTASRLGLKRPEFVRMELDRLGIMVSIEKYQYANKVYKLPPSPSLA
jgi:transposase